MKAAAELSKAWHDIQRSVRGGSGFGAKA